MTSESTVMQLASEPPERSAQRWSERAARIIAFGLGAVFLWAAFWKAVDPRGTEAVFAFVLAEGPVATALTHGLVYFEVILGVAIVLGVHSSGSLAVAAVALLVFTAWAATAWALSFQVGCGCARLGADSGANQVALIDVIRTSALATAGVVGWCLARRTSCATLLTDRSNERSPV